MESGKEEEKKKTPVKTWKNALKCPSLTSFILLAVVAATVFRLTRNNGNVVSLENLVVLKEDQQTVSKNGAIPDCNLFSGRWVYDDVSYPLYKDSQCSFMEVEFACERYRRPNLKYQHWRWQPHHCDIPRFNGPAFLEKIRGKKLVFVGDSLCRNQWESMLCMLESYLPPSSDKTLKWRGNLQYLQVDEYNATIGFYWAPMLVESNCDDFRLHRAQPRVIRVKSIISHGRHWIDADILIFDSFVWWMSPEMAILWGKFDSPDAIYQKQNIEMKNRRYEIALNTWSDWLEMHINRSKTKIFFMSHSPYHWGGSMWGTTNCINETEPISDQTYWPSAVKRDMMQIVESIIEKLEQRGVKVEYLNITQLSAYREDAHPSIYRGFPGVPLEKIYKNISSYSDCVHWCLPGVPDVWNQILYAYLMKS